MARLSKLEQETIISYNQADTDATIYTCNSSLIKKLQKLSEKHPDMFKLIRKEIEGAYTFTAPKKYVKVNAPRNHK